MALLCLVSLLASSTAASHLVDDATLLIQVQAVESQVPQISKEMLIKAATDMGKKAIKDSIQQKMPLGLGRVLVNDKEKALVQQCSDISSSLYCGMSDKVYGINCLGWGGSHCLAHGEQCGSITLPGICNSAIHRVNISCLGWGGSSCLPHGADASSITSETLCVNAEAKFGIRSAGWSGKECFSEKTKKCEKIALPGICNDAKKRLGLECTGWGGSSCLSKTEQACEQISSRHICQVAKERFGLSCTWDGDCVGAKDTA